MLASPVPMRWSVIAAIIWLAHAVGGAQAELLARLVEHVDRAGVGARELHRAADDGGEHGFEVERRIDRLGDLAQRPELADRLLQIVGAGAQFVEQADVLDGDHGLVGEVGHQLDLLVGEGADLLAIDADGAGQFVFLKHRDDEQCASATQFCDYIVGIFRSDILNVN